MDRQQFATLAIGIKSAYSASKILEDNASMDFWYTMLKDILYEIAENAVMEHICTNVFTPSIADIRKLCVERCKAPVLSAGEAWSAVQNAIFKYGLNYPHEAYETLDELTLAVVKEMDWSRLCKSEFPAADRADFKESYEAKVKSLQNAYLLPKFVAQNKALLKKRYIPLTENNEQERIGYDETVCEKRRELTDTQRIEVARQFDEARRRILSGYERYKIGDTGD